MVTIQSYHGLLRKDVGQEVKACHSLCCALEARRPDRHASRTDHILMHFFLHYGPSSATPAQGGTRHGYLSSSWSPSQPLLRQPHRPFPPPSVSIVPYPLSCSRADFRPQSQSQPSLLHSSLRCRRSWTSATAEGGGSHTLGWMNKACPLLEVPSTLDQRLDILSGVPNRLQVSS